MMMLVAAQFYDQNYYNTQNYNSQYYAGYNTGAYDRYGNPINSYSGAPSPNTYGYNSYGSNQLYNQPYNQYTTPNNNYYSGSSTNPYGYNAYNTPSSNYNTYNTYGSNAYYGGNGYLGGSNYYQSTFPNSGYAGYGGTSASTYWPQLFGNAASQSCSGVSTDFLMVIPPGACTPNVVRSDILAGQNVPVFCKVATLKLNPLIDSSAIQSMTFTGDYPEGVIGISYHPGRQGIRQYNTILSSPLNDDAGYVVITLARQPDERNLPEFIEGNISAQLRYDARQLVGTSNAEYYLDADDGKVAFWNAKGYLEVTGVSGGMAQVNVYADPQSAPVQSFSLAQGQVSPMIHLPGYYCTAGMQIMMNAVTSPDDMALLNVEGDTIWVREGSRFYNNLCFVNSITIQGGGAGTVDVSCSGQRFTLRLGDRGVRINTGERVEEYAIGEQITYNDQSYYLGYYGRDPRGRAFALLTTESLDDRDLAFINNHYQGREWTGTSTTDFESSLGATTEGAQRIGTVGTDYFVLYPETEVNSANSVDGIYFSELGGTFQNTDRYGVAAPLQRGTMTVNELVSTYGVEPKTEETTWGEEALYEQIRISGQAGHHATQQELITRFEQAYPSSDYLPSILDLKEANNQYDTSAAHASVRVNNEYFNIFVESFRAERDLDKSATIRIGARSAEFVREGDTIPFDDGTLTIDNIDVSGVTFRYTANDSRVETRPIALRSFGLIGGREIEVRDIESREVAHVSVIPRVNNNQNSQTDFAFKIGIEKRNIELNPDRAKAAIEGLNQSIQLWEDVLDKLGNVIRVWKAACFATSSILMLETMLDGFNDESIARGKVMDQYKAICDREIASGRYTSRTECYNDLSESVDADVLRMQEAIGSVNDELRIVQEGNVESIGVFGEGNIVNQSQYVQDLKENLMWDGVEVNGVKVETDDLSKSTEVRSVLLYQKLGCSVDANICANNPSENVACCAAYDEMIHTLGSAAVQKDATIEGNRVTQNIRQVIGDTAPQVQIVNTQGVQTLNWNGQRGQDITANRPAGIANDDKIQFMSVNGKTYLVKLQDATLGGSMGVVQAYRLEGTVWVEETNLTNHDLASFVFRGGSQNACEGNIIQNPEVRYYETGRNAGLPALVPFDVQNGWYVSVPNSQGSIVQGSLQSYTAAGDVSFFWICNVGSNGIVEYRSGDDLCQSFSGNQVGFTNFIACGLEGAEVNQLYARARDAIRQAAQGYGRGGYVNVFGQTLGTGAPLTDTGGVECQDFMSPDDCKLLFNACDPVICPASRCDLGGKYPVYDVIQTGVIGSLTLCLPNIREGVVVPICLTGVHAGIDAFVSILRSEQACLAHHLETGEYVGICDEITAIYMCEFFWRQFGSVLDVILPSFFESVLGQPRVRGGGEYLSVYSAFDNLERSTQYFTGSYAQNSYAAYQLRSAQNVGVEVCNGFLGTSVPLGLTAQGFDAFLAPDSPPQFYAYFSEVPFSSATSPATSHYKVYYHIYAGNTFGANYQVYLRGRNQNSGTGSFGTPFSGGGVSGAQFNNQYNNQYGVGGYGYPYGGGNVNQNQFGGGSFNSFGSFGGSANVKSGFVPRGESADEAIDFTAPSGYTELCVRINNQERCGFGSVTTSFAINYATEQYAQDQASQMSITSESACVSTTASAWGLLAPNAQAGFETAIGGQDISLTGITRVCATQSPGAGIGGGASNAQINQIVCRNDQDCGSGYVCSKTSGSEVGNCIGTSGATQQQAGRWVDVGYCGDPAIRCWLDSESLRDRFRTIDAVNQGIYGQQGTVMDTLRYGQMFNDLEGSYQQSRASLSEQYNAIHALTPTELREGESNAKIQSIIAQIDHITGTTGAGLGTANNKAEALALKATVYRMIVEQKMRDTSDVVGRGTPVPQPPVQQQPPQTNPNQQPDTITQPAIHVMHENNKFYVARGGIASNIYIQNNLLLKEQAGNPLIVGRILEDGTITITQPAESFAGSSVGILNNLRYDETRGTIE